jgi:Uma2 family endonuclease
MSQAIEITQDEQLTIEIARLFPRQGQWTEADYFRLPETNRIIELSEGRLIITPSPTTQHQRIVLKLSYLLFDHVSSYNLGELIIAPMDTKLWEGKIRQPDIAFMSNDHLDRITEQLWGVPDLVVEILSEGTAKIDKEDKYLEYQRAGVQEYWIVDPFNQSIEVYALKNGIYEIFGKWGPGEIAKSKLLDGFKVSINSIMA